ncbi:winged helix-turn-helix transcriptional regulator [Lentzea aerocolonigenes]|uniref:winged helix-turn-helix transcriptional regulator n=1 Tax=Lentzea aerocolonigenes TaxID=68170 RepID=UPI00068B5B72|nr:winged helix-turn-helix transcriptional regulator [Lentzea aerocolonigenes]MCP2250358.1 transcriptional regulator, HxlR family [Lentzea aerocolonigenes]
MECQHGEPTTNAVVDLPYRIGDKSTTHVLRGLPVVTPKVLTGTLRAVERDGTVVREAFDENPPRVEYELTARGRKMLGLLDLCCDWARENWAGQNWARENLVDTDAS